MEPLLSRLETVNQQVGEDAPINPREELTTHDRIYKSTLLCPDIVLHAATKVTKVLTESVDDD